MCAAQSQPTLESKLEALQCHFTWDLNEGDNKLFCLRDKLVDIGTEEGNRWLGHIYNLRGYIQYKLGFTEDAQSFFTKAAEAFCNIREAVEGPWLVVNYGNLAWLHHLLGDQGKSQDYLSKVDALMQKYPSPPQHELHAETYAEKAWTLMKFSRDKQLLAVDYFEKAIGMQPEMVEWNSSYVLLLRNDFKYDHTKHSNTKLEDEILEKMRIAKEQDPEDLYLAVQYLHQRFKKGKRRSKKEERIDEDEVRELRTKVLRNPVSSYSGLNTLIWVYRKYVSVEEATSLAEVALKNHPSERYLKRCAALPYKWIIWRDSNPDKNTLQRAISLQEEVISLYPDSSLLKKIDLANMYAKTDWGNARAEQMYQELLGMDLEPADKQMLYNHYANYLFFILKNKCKSIDYHMKAAEIPHQSFYRKQSIRVLEKIRDGRSNPRWREIEEFLENLPNL